jgi:hypothetical protein
MLPHCVTSKFLFFSAQSRFGTFLQNWGKSQDFRIMKSDGHMESDLLLQVLIQVPVCQLAAGTYRLLLAVGNELGQWRSMGRFLLGQDVFEQCIIQPKDIIDENHTFLGSVSLIGQSRLAESPLLLLCDNLSRAGPPLLECQSVHTFGGGATKPARQRPCRPWTMPQLSLLACPRVSVAASTKWW